MLLGLLSFTMETYSEVPGVVLDYEATYYRAGSSAPGKYITDPEILVLSNGTYIASHALSGWDSGATESGITSIFKSEDQGASWSELTPQTGVLRGSLFELGSALYLLGAEKESGAAVILKSENEGGSWTSASFSSFSGMDTPNSPVVFNNRIWSADGRASFSAPVESNLLLESSWMRGFGFPYPPESDWLSGMAIISEGQIVASPGLGIYILPKVGDHPYTTLAHVNPSTGAVSFDPDTDYAFLPGGEKKFGATYDSVSGKFYVLSSPVLPVHYDSGIIPSFIRNAGAMLSSKDLRNWDVEKIFLYSENVGTEGFCYFNFDFDGTNMVVAARTAFEASPDPGPERGDHSNYLTFHMITDFRNATPEQVLKIEGADVIRYEKTQYQDAPIGSFAQGSSFDGAPLTSPSEFGKDANGDVYIRETGGRILRFDAGGNFIETVAEASVAFQSSELAVDQPGFSTWIKPGSGEWFDSTNWLYWGRADTDDDIAVFGSAADAPSTVTVSPYMLEWVVKGVRFRNANAYTIAGDNELIIDAGSGSGSLEVQEGSHQIQLPVTLAGDTTFSAEDGASLTLSSNVVKLAGHTLDVESGQLNVKDGKFFLNEGALVVSGGTVVMEDTWVDFSGTIEFPAPAGFAPSAGQGFQLFSGNLTNVWFDQVILPDLEDGLGWDTSSLYSNGTVSVVLRVPKAWMAQYGFSTDGSDDFIDSDGDAQDNYAEWRAGTNPTNAFSYFDFQAGTSPVSTGIRLRWNSLASRTYQIDFSTNLLVNPAFSVLTNGISGEEGTTDFIDTAATNKPCGFYRIHVE